MITTSAAVATALTALGKVICDITISPFADRFKDFFDRREAERKIRCAVMKASRDIAEAFQGDDSNPEALEQITLLFQTWLADHPKWFTARKAVENNLDANKLAESLEQEVPLPKEYSGHEKIYHKMSQCIADQLISISYLFKNLGDEQWRFTIELIERLQDKIATENTQKEILQCVKKILEAYTCLLRLESAPIPLKRIDDPDHYFMKRDGGDREFSQPRFVRPWGPIWLDFEEGYVWEDTQRIKAIIDKLLRGEGPVIIKGEAASGKSVLLRAIAYNLIKEQDAIIYYIPLKSGEPPHAPSEFPFAEFEKSGAFLFIDDAHIDQASWIQKFWGNHRCNAGIKSRIVVASRPLEKLGPREVDPLGSSPYPGSFRYAIQQAEELKASDSLQPVFNQWKKIKASKYQAINIVQSVEKQLLRACGRSEWTSKSTVGDLWLLAFYLEALDGVEPDAIVQELPDINQEITRYLQKRLSEMHVKDKEALKNSDEVMLPLAYASRFEIPLPCGIIRQILGELYESLPKHDRPVESYETTLQRLVECREIVHSEVSHSYSLPHSARALSFWQAYNAGSSLGEKMKQFLKHAYQPHYNDWRLSLIDYICRKLPQEAAVLLKNEDRSLLLAIANSQSDIAVIKNALMEAKSIPDTAVLLDSLKEAGYAQMESLLKQLSPDQPARKILRTKDFSHVESVLAALKNSGYSPMESLLRLFPPKQLAQEILQTDDFRYAQSIFNALSRVGYTQMESLLQLLLPNQLAQKILRAKYLWGIRLFLDSLKEAGYPQMESLSKLLPPSQLAQNILQKKDFLHTGSLLESLKEVGYTQMESLLQRLPPGQLAQKILQEEYLPHTIGLLDSLKEVGYAQMESLLKQLSPEQLAQKILQTEDIGVDLILTSLKEAGYPQMESLLKQLPPGQLARKTLQVGHVMDTAARLKALKEAGYPQMESLLEQLLPEQLAQRILHTEDIAKAGLSIESLKEAGYPQMESLLKQLPPGQLAQKILQEDYFRDIISLLESLKEVGYTQMESLLQRLPPGQLAQNILWAEDLPGTIGLLDSLKEAGYAQMESLLKRLPPGQLAQKILQEDSIGYEMQFLYFLEKADYPKMKSLLKRLPPKQLARKIMRDLWATGGLLYSLKNAGYTQMKLLLKLLPPKQLARRIAKEPSGAEELLSDLKEVGYPQMKLLLKLLRGKRRL